MGRRERGVDPVPGTPGCLRQPGSGPLIRVWDGWASAREAKPVGMAEGRSGWRKSSARDGVAWSMRRDSPRATCPENRRAESALRQWVAAPRTGRPSCPCDVPRTRRASIRRPTPPASLALGGQTAGPKPPPLRGVTRSGPATQRGKGAQGAAGNGGRRSPAPIPEGSTAKKRESGRG